MRSGLYQTWVRTSTGGHEDAALPSRREALERDLGRLGLADELRRGEGVLGHDGVRAVEHEADLGRATAGQSIAIVGRHDERGSCRALADERLDLGLGVRHVVLAEVARCSEGLDQLA